MAVDCRGLHLSHIPKDLPTDTNTLLLSNNNIPAIKPRALVNIPNLTHLDISVNSITKFDNDSLLGGGNLEVLILNDNPLFLSYESFPQNLFKSTPKLRVLQLMTLDISDSCYIEKTLVHAHQLEELYIQGIPRKPFGEEFRLLHKLKKLYITGIGSHMISITNDTFQVFNDSHVNELSLQRSDIKRMEAGALIHFKVLQILNLACNYYMTLATALNAIQMMSTKILDTVILDDIQPTMLFAQITKNDICATNIFHNVTHFTLRANKIIHFDLEFFECLTNIKYLGIGFNSPLLANKTDWVQRLIHFLNQTTIETFDLSYLFNTIGRTFRDKFCFNFADSQLFFRKPPDFIKLHLNENSIFENNNILRTIGFKDNSQIIQDFPKSQNYHILSKNTGESDEVIIFHHIPHSLKYLYIDHLPFQHNTGLKRNVSINLDNSILLLNFSNTKISYMYYPLQGLNSLQALDMRDGRSLCHLVDSSFYYLPSLLYLNISGNVLGQCNQTFEYLFTKVTSMEYLDISNNFIHDIHPEAFHTLKSLKVLAIQQNKLTGKQHLHIGHLHNLEYLDLSRNLFSHLQNSLTEQLDMIALKSDIKVNLDGNLFLCTCAQISFIKWIQNTNISLTNKETYTCNMFDKTEIHIVSVNIAEMVEICQQKGNGVPMVVVVSAYIGAVTVVLIMTSMIYYWRRSLKWYHYRIR